MNNKKHIQKPRLLIILSTSNIHIAQWSTLGNTLIQKCSLEPSIIRNGIIIGLEQIAQKANVILKNTSDYRYAYIALEKDIMHEQVTTEQPSATLCSAFQLSATHWYSCSLERLQLFQLQLLSFQLKRSFVFLSSALTCLVHQLMNNNLITKADLAHVTCLESLKALITQKLDQPDLLMLTFQGLYKLGYQQSCNLT